MTPTTDPSNRRGTRKSYESRLAVPFEALTHRGQTRRLRHLALAALRDYPIGVTRLELLQYEDNAVYQATTGAGEQFILRVGAADGHSVPEQRAELLWLQALGRDTGLALPIPIPTARGEPLTLAEAPDVPGPRPCVLFRRVPGHPPTSTMRPATVARLGALTAQLHRHAERFVPPPGFARPSWGWDRLFGPSSALASATLPARDRATLTDVGTLVRERLDALGTEPAVWGLTHADLHIGNLLIDHGRVGVIDFDDCGWGYYLLDIATVLSSVRRVVPDSHTYAALRAAYLSGYAALRPLPPALDAQLPTFAVLRAMVIVNFILASTNAQVQTWGPARIAGILHDMERYLAGDTTATIQIGALAPLHLASVPAGYPIGPASAMLGVPLGVLCGDPGPIGADWAQREIGNGPHTPASRTVDTRQAIPPNSAPRGVL